MGTTSGWNSYDGTRETMPQEMRDHIEAERKREPIAEVIIKLYSLDKGQSELQVWLSPNGELKDGASDGSGRSAAYQKLLECLQRELAAGLGIIRDH